jgi:hypothetical protein
MLPCATALISVSGTRAGPIWMEAPVHDPLRCACIEAVNQHCRPNVMLLAEWEEWYHACDHVQAAAALVTADRWSALRLTCPFTKLYTICQLLTWWSRTRCMCCQLSLASLYRSPLPQLALAYLARTGKDTRVASVGRMHLAITRKHCKTRLRQHEVRSSASPVGWRVARSPAMTRWWHPTQLTMLSAS